MLCLVTSVLKRASTKATASSEGGLYYDLSRVGYGIVCGSIDQIVCGEGLVCGLF